MARVNWTDIENDLIVADYFAMFKKDLAGEPLNKTEHRNALLPLLNGRTRTSVEYKHQNISAVLKAMGETWLTGYVPAQNLQTSLVDAVVRWLASNQTWLNRPVQRSARRGLAEPSQLWVGPPPTQSNSLPPAEAEKYYNIAIRTDAAGRDERNRNLGRAGEEYVLAYEKASLRANGRDDLARNVRWISDEEGDGAGYDIASFASDGSPRLLEIKTTNGWERTPFHISRNELRVANERRDEWHLFRLYNFAREPKAFELRPPLEAHVSLTATSFQANFN